MNNESDPLRIHVNDRIHLSAFRGSDKRALVEYLNDEAIYRYTLRIPFPYTEADADAFLGIVAEATERHGHPVHFAIRNESGKAIGGCGFEELTSGHRVEIGYWLAKPLWGNGIMTGVVRQLCAFAFSHWKIVRITAHVFVFNEASARVLEKNAFRYEGLLRKHHRKDGKFVDSKLYARVI